MIQYRFAIGAIVDIMKDMNLEWEEDPYRRWSHTWDHNLTRVVDGLKVWCHDSGIKRYDIGFTQIELCVTFLDSREAMFFKLRWRGAKSP